MVIGVLKVLVPKCMTSFSPSYDVVAFLEPRQMMWLILLLILADEDSSFDPLPSKWLIARCSSDDGVLDLAADPLQTTFRISFAHGLLPKLAINQD